MPEIATERLLVITFEAEMMTALLEGTEKLEKLIPYKVPVKYPMDVYKQFFPYKIKRFSQYPEENKWEGLIIDKENQTVIGDIGYKEGPNEKGEINLGYSILSRYQGKGYATEAALAMVKWGLSQPDVQKITATCSPENLASIRVLEKAGLRQTHKDEKKIYWLS